MAQPPPGSSKKPEPSYGRRNFLKQSVVSLGVTVHKYVEHRDATDSQEEKPEKRRTDWLRPPGALEEAQFLESCTGCGECIEACPHESIRVLEDSHVSDGLPRKGTPVIYPDEQPCYLCEDFPCIAACEPEALRPVGTVKAVSMGTAVVSQRICTAGQGCNACVGQCPTQAISMDFASLSIRVGGDLCVGCGICEHICKTVNDHIAIKVAPARLGTLS